jgi:hypothetical protein
METEIMSELEFKGWLLNALQGTWTDTISPGSGSTFGFPDIGVIVPGTPLYLPIELKLAEVKATASRHVRRTMSDGVVVNSLIPPENRVRPSRLRPSQIVWHDGFTRAGCYSRIVLGARMADGWDAWVIDRPHVEQLRNWKDGFLLEHLPLVATESRLNLRAWWDGPLFWWQDHVMRMAVAHPRLGAPEPADAIKRAARQGA